MGRIFFDLIWLVFLLLMLKHFWQKKRYLKQTEQWFETQGEITKFSWKQQRYRRWPKITYCYRVFEQDYRSEQFLLDDAYSNPNTLSARKLAYRAALAYERKERLTVYYNPDNPGQAVLDIRLPFKLFFIISLLFCLIVGQLGVVAYHLLHLQALPYKDKLLGLLSIVN